MHIDATTLSDLAVFRSPDGSAGLFQLIDRTFTTQGRKALRRRLDRPLVHLGELRRTQDAVRFLARQPRLVRLSRDSLETVDRYLHSNIEVGARFPLGGRLEYLWVTVRYRDLVRELRSGVNQTIAFADDLDRLGRSIEDRDPPDLIAELAAELRRAARAVLRLPATAAGLLTMDRAFREELRDDLERALGAVAELDALNAMALSTVALGWTMPELVESGAFLLDATGVFRPFVEAPVPNAIRLSGGEPLIFLTGPNMAGKTTYLRSVALVVFLAQVGMGVPAASARLTPVEALVTSLNPSDNLKAGLSYFLAEVLRVRTAASLLAAGQRSLVLFDEVFKGTNVKDALEASAEVILGFARARRSGFIFASHLAELAEILKSNPTIRFCCFDGEIVGGAPRNSYALRDGVSDKRFGLLLLRQARIPELIASIAS